MRVPSFVYVLPLLSCCLCKSFLCSSRQKQEREQLIKQLSQLVCMELMEEIIKESVQDASADELKYVQDTLCSTLLFDYFLRVRICQGVVSFLLGLL